MDPSCKERRPGLTIIHLAFVVSALMLAYIDRLMGLSKGKKGKAG
ncbi:MULTISPECIES: hypothetical protein [unclassified Mesorhizobium]|nr:MULTISPECIES: hypothetical protein [unclassified Mesorhizobium]